MQEQRANAYRSFLRELIRPFAGFEYYQSGEGYDKLDTPPEKLIEVIDHTLDTFPKREREVIRYRWGLDDGKKKTLEYTGKSLYNVTGQRASAIHAKGFRRLRHPRYGMQIIEALEDDTIATMYAQHWLSTYQELGELGITIIGQTQIEALERLFR